MKQESPTSKSGGGSNTCSRMKKIKNYLFLNENFNII